MQDYAKLYKKSFRERRSQTVFGQIRRILYGKLSPVMQLAAIMILLTPRHKV